MQPVDLAQESLASVLQRVTAALAARDAKPVEAKPVDAAPVAAAPKASRDTLALSEAPSTAMPQLPIGHGAKDKDYGRRDAGGKTGGPVRRLQKALAELGHFRSVHGATGGYFKDTGRAVAAFQRSAGLAATGVVDEATWRALEARVASAEPTPKPSTPKPSTPSPSTPTPTPASSRLASLTPAALAELGRTDKKAFFEALRPAAEEAERRYGVPAAVTLAQAALESGWAKHAIGGYNIFGIKGKGPAGSVEKVTHEKNRTERIVARFAKYDNFHQAVAEHGKLFHNGYYKKAMAQYAKDGNAEAFARNISDIYTQDGATYGQQVIQMMRKYGLDR